MSRPFYQTQSFSSPYSLKKEHYQETELNKLPPEIAASISPSIPSDVNTTLFGVNRLIAFQKNQSVIKQSDLLQRKDDSLFLKQPQEETTNHLG